MWAYKNVVMKPHPIPPAAWMYTRPAVCPSLSLSLSLSHSLSLSLPLSLALGQSLSERVYHPSCNNQLRRFEIRMWQVFLKMNRTTSSFTQTIDRSVAGIPLGQLKIWRGKRKVNKLHNIFMNLISCSTIDCQSSGWRGALSRGCTWFIFSLTFPLGPWCKMRPL